jgi:hypothetical protein
MLDRYRLRVRLLGSQPCEGCSGAHAACSASVAAICSEFVGNQIGPTPMHLGRVGWVRMSVRPLGSWLCRCLLLAARCAPGIGPGLLFQGGGKTALADPHRLLSGVRCVPGIGPGLCSKVVGNQIWQTPIRCLVHVGRVGMRGRPLGGQPCAWLLPGARSMLGFRPGPLFRVCGISDSADPRSLGRARWVGKDAGQATGQLAIQMVAVGGAVRARHRSWPFVPSWWEIRFGRPSIVARCMLAG